MITKFIAEVSSNHHQDLKRCINFINVASDIGCDAVKFQLFQLDELFSVEARRARPEFEDRRNWELPVEYLSTLKDHCDKKEIEFSCTPFYLSAVQELEPYVDFYKIASYELLWHDLILEVAKTGKKLVLSTGMATLSEIEQALAVFRSASSADLTLLHCISGYPTPLKDCNLNAIETLRKNFNTSVGRSDHSKSKFVVERSISKWGATTIEFHLDLDGQGDEFKTGHCWLPTEISEVIENVRKYELIDGSGNKEPMASEIFDREWRADPIDGQRPLIKTRMSL